MDRGALRGCDDRGVAVPSDPENRFWAPPSPTGAGRDWNPPAPNASRPALRRATPDSVDMPTPWMAGVASGLAVHARVPVHVVRWAFAALTLFGGTGLLLYLWLWMMTPKDTGRFAPNGIGGSRAAAPLRVPGEDRSRITARNQLFLAGFIIIVGGLIALGLSAFGVVDLKDIVSASTVIIGIGLAWSQGANLDNWRSGRFLVIVSIGVIMVSIGTIVLVGRGDPPLILLRGGLIGAVVVAGVLFALAPLWLRTSSDLSDTQAQQVRDAERADIAAHLHDSVLQTLTLIRSAAHDPARVRALALSEERELRSWLYTGRSQAADSLAEAVRETVGALESKYGVPVEVVAVGDCVPGPGELALVAALGEASANAVRHGRPPVSVYVETRPESVEAFIKDSGSGFDPASIPSDRHGVKDSIIGRMERAGGTARIRCLTTGTEIALTLPRIPSTAPFQPKRG